MEYKSKDEINKMNSNQIDKYVVELEGEQERTYEESAEYWREQGNNELADVFDNLSARWFAIEDGEPVDTLYTIGDLDVGDYVTDGSGEYAIVKMSAEFGKYYANVNQYDIEDEETISIVSDIFHDYCSE